MCTCTLPAGAWNSKVYHFPPRESRMNSYFAGYHMARIVYGSHVRLRSTAGLMSCHRDGGILDHGELHPLPESEYAD